MNDWVMRLAGAGLMILLGVAVGVWLATSHFRPALDEEQDRVAACTAARDNLEGLAQEQGRALGDLTLAANERQARAEQAVSEAKASAGIDFAAANRLQQERTGGDQCEAATSIIDQELGL
ncbi:hypothetical protein LU674_024570 [Pseudomonas alloputida]|uniref:DUF2514 family protein n=2 Tax=Pseudomonas TaxID=286 RepID=A0AAW7I098_9PSED|nr:MULTISPECIES: hypothetical protein [Pseudomonas]MCE0865591.1 hypothetical protein [Pseudomonas alloputida]MCE0869280.1 hypothetical protein [Pseudomonas alloputida]MCE0894482.1 hypothetical protein [Pseudomonas alloputida]MCE0923758.1 hypothetical protein [Pseudomonas alloputida]MCE1050067.1 hypothetical protein [Pseudomonas alloputida]